MLPLIDSKCIDEQVHKLTNSTFTRASFAFRFDFLPVSQVRQAYSPITLVPLSLPPLGTKAPAETDLQCCSLSLLFHSGNRKSLSSTEPRHRFPKKAAHCYGAVLALYQAQQGCAFKEAPAPGCTLLSSVKQCHRLHCFQPYLS